ncbi:cupin domain-containing protein [Roseospira navarrensis]|uniref:Cupin domain-containing protein n=1 Tax=Roseospira navarrensis TaxID=140058 RepID=A0A7X2D4W5_9PROT|nr:cupin domain-containing protein [Roseospira navarrensis]MQX38271.1 cupin domain-containing protein [Roseospira navarrensis]
MPSGLLAGLSADDVIARLGLVPHPAEGGHFRETWRGTDTLAGAALPACYRGGDRSVGTAIYYLLTPGTRSALHRLASDEVFHHYIGDAVEQLRLHPDGRSEVVVIGGDLTAGQTPQTVVPRGVWQGARLVAGGAWALMGCTVSPGFDFADYEHGDRAALTARWPDAAEMIAALTDLYRPT